MLKLTHVQARLHIKAGRATVKQMEPTLLEDRQRAEAVMAIFRQALEAGLNRDELYARLSEHSGVRLDYREIDGLAKVICDSFAAFEPLVGGHWSSQAGTGQISQPGTGTENQADAENRVAEDELETGEDGADLDDDDASLELEAEHRPLTAFRLAVWREVARPENYPFRQTGLSFTLKPGVQNLRRAVATYDEELLASLLPLPRRVGLLQKAAAETGYILAKPPENAKAVGDLLFGDLPGRHRLVALSSDLNVENLLNRYNIEVLRGVLYLAPRLKIVVRDKYKDLFKYIKLFGLMHEVRPLSRHKSNTSGIVTEGELGGYEILLEGAASPFLARSDRRYGLQFAKFLPALLLCEADWDLEAELVLNFAPRPGGKEQPTAGSGIVYRLGPQPHLRSHFKGSGEFDSLLEESLAAAFEKRFKTTTRPPIPDPTADPLPQTEATPKTKSRKRKPPPNPEERKGWRILREDRIINVFDTVMIPDFAFEHSDGRRALLEVVGFWERGYLERKIAKLNRAGRTDFIVLVSERTRCGRENFLVKGQEPPYQLIFFKGTPRLGPIMEALERCAVPATTPAEEQL